MANEIILRQSSLDRVSPPPPFSTQLNLTPQFFISEELFYQLALRQFGLMNRINLKPAPSLRTLVRLGVESEEEDSRKSGLSTDEIINVSTPHPATFATIKTVDLFHPD